MKIIAPISEYVKPIDSEVNALESTEADEAAWDAYWNAIEPATVERMAAESAYANLVESGELPW